MRRRVDSLWGLMIACAAIYGSLAIFMGVIPGVAFSRATPTPGLQPFTAAEQRGREIYVGEGCSYCHTQMVRPLRQDLVFGRPSVAGDYAYSTPQLLGDHRNGPDLTDIGTRQPSRVWQYIHLWDPRAVVHGSIMPRYPWLFVVKASAAPGDEVVPVPPGHGPASGVVVTTQDSRDLVAYLLALKQVSLGKGMSQ
jgi:cytochrome c oxidase cbb3-type subunit II